MKVRNPRLRLVLGNHWRVMVALLVVGALLSFVAAGAVYANPSTDTVTQDAHRQEVATTTATSAEVVGEDSLWPPGTVLEDRPVYLTNATPTVDATATTRIDGADDARIHHEWALTIQAVRGGEVFYSETIGLEEATHRGTTANTTATVDVPAVRQRVAAVKEHVGTAGTVSANLTLAVNYETDPGTDHGYTDNETYTAPLVLEPGAYAIEEPPGGSTDHSRTVTTEVTAPRDWGQMTALVLFGLVSLLFAGAVVSLDPDEIDVEQARIDRHRTRYEEWISPGIIPMSISQQFIELESIEDVVDVAIDTNERVVYDRRRDLYAVISENVVYYFSQGGSWIETAFGGPANLGGAGGSDRYDAPPGDVGIDEPGARDFGFGTPDEGSPFGESDDAADDGDWPDGDGGDDADGVDGDPFGDDGNPFEESDER